MDCELLVDFDRGVAPYSDGDHLVNFAGAAKVNVPEGRAPPKSAASTGCIPAPATE
jgi:hypothetical protein